ncbi:YhcH/YjgK/YiaL family protein [candidate division KSB1 bacterium]|nr:YhcH/YjgK/YiaL family protein [candidate division KSB1 bacterium]
MIIATLDQANEYVDMHPSFAKAFDFLRQENLANLPPGRYDLDGDRLYCTVSMDSGKTRQEARLEAHRKYIDIQYVIAGDEEMGWRPSAQCSDIHTPYDDAKDILFYNDEIKTWSTVPPGSFVIFTPQDAHAPMVGKGEIHKVVCKILQ